MSLLNMLLNLFHKNRKSCLLLNKPIFSRQLFGYLQIINSFNSCGNQLHKLWKKESQSRRVTTLFKYHTLAKQNPLLYLEMFRNSSDAAAAYLRCSSGYVPPQQPFLTFNSLEFQDLDSCCYLEIFILPIYSYFPYSYLSYGQQQFVKWV